MNERSIAGVDFGVKWNIGYGANAGVMRVLARCAILTSIPYSSTQNALTRLCRLIESVILRPAAKPVRGADCEVAA